MGRVCHGLQVELRRQLSEVLSPLAHGQVRWPTLVADTITHWTSLLTQSIHSCSLVKVKFFQGILEDLFPNEFLKQSMDNSLRDGKCRGHSAGPPPIHLSSLCIFEATLKTPQYSSLDLNFSSHTQSNGLSEVSVPRGLELSPHTDS